MKFVTRALETFYKTLDNPEEVHQQQVSRTHVHKFPGGVAPPVFPAGSLQESHGPGHHHEAGRVDRKRPQERRSDSVVETRDALGTDALLHTVQGVLVHGAPVHSVHLHPRLDHVHGVRQRPREHPGHPPARQHRARGHRRPVFGPRQHLVRAEVNGEAGNVPAHGQRQSPEDASGSFQLVDVSQAAEHGGVAVGHLHAQLEQVERAGEEALEESRGGPGAEVRQEGVGVGGVALSVAVNAEDYGVRGGDPGQGTRDAPVYASDSIFAQNGAKAVERAAVPRVLRVLYLEVCLHRVQGVADQKSGATWKETIKYFQ